MNRCFDCKRTTDTCACGSVPVPVISRIKAPLGIDPNVTRWATWAYDGMGAPPEGFSHLKEGVVAVHEIPTHGYVTWKAYCCSCRGLFGEWEQLVMGATGSGFPGRDRLERATRDRLYDLGFRIYPNGYAQCTTCLDGTVLDCEISEGVLPDPVPWFSDWLVANAD